MIWSGRKQYIEGVKVGEMEGDMYRERYRDNMGERARYIWVELGV